MLKRIDWVNLSCDLKNIGIDISDICINARKFYNEISFVDRNIENTKKAISSLISSNMFLVNARHILKSYIMPETNEYIRKDDELNETYKWLVDNLGRVELRIDDMKEKTLQQVENSSYTSTKPRAIVKIKSYYIFLNEILEYLVYYPLKRAYQTYSESDSFYISGTNINKEINVFWYLVFIQFFHSSEIMGSLTGTKQVVPKNLGFQSLRPTRRTRSSNSPTDSSKNTKDSEGDYSEEERIGFDDLPEEEEVEIEDVI